MLASLPPSVTAAFDGGNILCDHVQVQAEPRTARFDLRIRPEPFTEGTDRTNHYQWFYFRCCNVAGTQCTFRITNAGGSSYPPGWKNYRTFQSFDQSQWTRCQATTYDEESGVLTWTVDFPESQSSAWFAYFVPYTYEQHQALVGRCAQSPLASLHNLGLTKDGRPLDLLVISEGAGKSGGAGPEAKSDGDSSDSPKLKFWVVGRQHPGESMAEFCVEGFLDRILSRDDAVAKKLRSIADFYVVPNANPDGTYRGHLRTNAVGANMNREWTSTGAHKAPSKHSSPEVFAILGALDSIGCDGYLDVHGDEEIEGNFLVCPRGAPNWTDDFEQRFATFENALVRANPDFQTVKGYGAVAPGKANLAICSAQITHRFGCFAATLEQPYKDTADEFPQADVGWNDSRCRLLGGTLADAWLALAGRLKQ